MVKQFFSLLICVAIATVSFANNEIQNNAPASSLIITMDASGQIIDMAAPKDWTTGRLRNYYLDFAHTQKTFDNIKLDAGTYEYKVTTERRNNKRGKVNFTVTELYKGHSPVSPKNEKLDRKFDSGRTNSGRFTLDDYNTKSSGGNYGYGKVKVHIGRAGANTNVWYKIELTRVGGNSSAPTASNNHSGSGTGNGSGGGRTFVKPNGSSASNNSSTCNYSNLGIDNGRIIGHTTGTYKAEKKACKNTVTVEVQKLDGKARTFVTVYASNSRNSRGSSKATYEFDRGNYKKTKKFTISGVNGKFIRVELKNRSATDTFKWKVKVKQ